MSEFDEGRTPPHDLLAEQSVLGAMMLSKVALSEALGTVTAADYYVPKHELMHQAIATLAERGDPVDAISVSDELRRTGDLSRAGGVEYSHVLTGAVLTPANVGYYASIVREKAILRRLIEAGTRIVDMSFRDTGDAQEIAESARAELDAAAQNARANLETIGGSFSALVDDLAKKPSYIESPWHELNDFIGGFRPGCVYVFGARPGEGKSIMGLQIAAGLAGVGPVAFSSLEMSTDQLLTRMVSMRGRVHMGPLSKHALDDEDWQKIAIARGSVVNMPLYVDDRSAQTMTQIKAFARSVSHKGKLAGVVIDYLQLVHATAEQSGRQRNEVVGEISRGAKALAKELHCPVIALAQLNRESVGKVRRAPQLTDLGESGSIERDADVVILTQRQLDEDNRPGDRLNMHAAKNRHGPTGMRTLLWEGQYSRVSSQRWGFQGYQAPVPD